MKKTLILFLLISQICFSQLGTTKSEMFENETTNYSNKDVQDGFTVYSYSGKIPLLNGKNCSELITYYISDDETEICFKVTYASCAAAANSYATVFNEIAVKIGKNKWKDYRNDSIYTLLIEGQFSYVEHYYDDE